MLGDLKLKIKTVAYKGSKRKLLKTIQLLAEEVNAKTFFDGFSGSGIVSAYMRQNGFEVIANDLNYSSYIYGKVFLEGYDEQIVNEQIKIMNEILIPKEGWITNNYSGEHERIIRGTNGKKESRPLGFTKPNAMKIDSARDYIKSLNINEKNKNALTFSIILAADKVFNNINDQKSALKKWTSNAKASIKFESPTLIDGPLGKQLLGNILKQKINADFVYFDPPYTSGVLYHTSYHLNDSLAI